MEQAKFYYTIGSDSIFSSNEISFPSEEALFDSVAEDLEVDGMFGDEKGVDVDVYEVHLVGRYRIHVDTKRVVKRRAAPKPAVKFDTPASNSAPKKKAGGK